MLGKTSMLGRKVRHVRDACQTWLRPRVARTVRRFSNATFIGVTGSSTKSTTTALLAQMLSGHGKVRPQILKNQLRDILKTVRRHRWGEKFVVAEVGTAGKGQIRPMADVLRPDVAIVTLIGIEHYTQFRSREAVAEEKGDLVEAVPPDGLVVLNADDEFAMSMASRTKARIVTFGRSERADYRVLSVRTSFPEGSVVEIAWAGGTLTVSTRLLGEHFWLPTVAATAAAIELGVPPDEVVRQAASFGALNNRWELYETADGPTFILDTAKAPNETLGLAFDAIGKLSAPSKTVVLGSISDFPGNPRPKYREAYRGARAVADRVIFIGDHSHRSGASDEDRATGRFLEMQEPRQIYDHLRATAKKGDLVLLKSSQGLHLERVALAFNMDVQCWQTTCGRKTGCRSCGLFGVPFEKHSTAANPPPAEPQVLGP